MNAGCGAYNNKGGSCHTFFDEIGDLLSKKQVRISPSTSFISSLIPFVAIVTLILTTARCLLTEPLRWEQEVAPRADTKGGYFVPWVWKK